jgi:WD40 repeat protein
MSTPRQFSPTLAFRLLGLCGCLLAAALAGCRPAPEGPAELTKPLLTLGGFKQAVGSVAYSPDGSLVAATDGKAVKVWEAGTGQEVVTFEAETRQGLAFNSDGKHLVLASWRDQIREARTGKAVLNFDRKNTGLSAIAASPDDRWVAIGSGRTFFGPPINRNEGLPGVPPEMVPERKEIGIIEVFDAKTGKLVRELGAPGRSMVTSLAFSTDGSRVAAVTRTETGDVGSMWDVSTGREVLNLVGPTDRLELVAFSPDGASVASFATTFPDPHPAETERKDAEWAARAESGARATATTQGGRVDLNGWPGAGLARGHREGTLPAAGIP